MRTVLALALALAASALPVFAAAPEPLVEVRRVPFEPSFEVSSSDRRRVVFHPAGEVGYAASDTRLFVFDARTGEDLGGLELAPATGYGSWDLARVGERLLTWSNYADGLALIDVGDPRSPEYLWSGFGVWKDPTVVATFGDAYFALRHGYAGFDLFTVQPLSRTASVPHALGSYSTFEGPYASGEDGGAAVLVFLERTVTAPIRRAIVAYDVVGGVPVHRFTREEAASVRSLLVDRSGEAIVALLDAYSPVRRTWIETIDARTGATLASWDVDAASRIVLAEGGGRWLARRDITGIDFVDLSDPSEPRPIGRVGLAPRTFTGGFGVTPSVVDPVVFVANGTDHEVLAIDPRSAAQIGRLPIEGGEPSEIVLGETEDGTRCAAVIAMRYDWYRTHSRGGLSHVDLADLTIPASPTWTGRFLRNHPGRVDGVGTIGGRYGLLYEIMRNSLAVVDLSDGRVAQVTGAAARLGEFDIYDAPELRTAGRFALLAGPVGWERFEWVRGRLEPLGGHIPPRGSWQGYDAVELAPDGTVIALGWRHEDGEWHYTFETSGIDGRTASVVRPYSRLLRLSVSPTGGLVAVSRPEYYGETAVDVYDVSDPSAPALLWTLPLDICEAKFDPTGTRLLVSGPLWDSEFWVQAFEARTGAPLGPPSQGIPKFDYHGFGSQWISDGKWGAIYWKWNWIGWDNVLVDLSGPEPTLMRTYYFNDAAPEFAPREGGGWYEVRRDPWENRSNMVVGNPDGEIAETGVTAGDQTGISAVRRGFVATVRPEPASLATSLWRDVTLNRPPVVVAGGDREVGCTGSDGAASSLDASASWDPDSAPGTTDDLASFAWTVDGADAGADPVVDVVLPLGTHAAAVEVTDALGATSSGSFAVAVVDRVAPDVVVEFEPLFDGGVFTRSFRVLPAATDLCDTSPSVEARLRIPEAASAAPVDWEHAAASSVEVRTGPKGTRVVVLGPDEDAARGAWEDARRGGGYALRSESLLALGAATRGLLWRFETEGLDLVRGVAYGDRDLVVDAEARDGSGNAAFVAASLRETVCATLPPGTGCPGP